MNRVFAALIAFFLVTSHAHSAGEDSPSAKSLAARLSSAEQGTTYVRLMMQIKDSAGAVKGSLQLQVKQRRTPERTDVLYQVLWPKERKGEAILLSQAGGGAASGELLSPAGTVRQLGASQMGGSLFGSSLSCQDAVENFFAWSNQSLAGSETVNRVNCVILESKPGDNDHSVYGSVRSWIDTRRLLPMRVEKYATSGKLVRRIDTNRVANDDNGHPIPAVLAVHGTDAGSETDLDGSRIRHDVGYTDADFSPEGMKDLSAPHPGAK